MAHLHIEVGKQRQQDHQHPAGDQQPYHLAGLAQQHAGNHVRGDQTGRQRQQLEHQVAEDGEGEIQAETLYVPGKFHGILEARFFLFHAAHAESPPFAAVSWPPMSLRYCAESRISCACTFGKDASAFHDDDLVGVLDGGQPVGDDQRRPAAADVAKTALHCDFVLSVQGGSRFIEDDDGRVAQKRPRQRHALPLAAGKAHAALAEHGLVAVRQAGNEIVDAGFLCGLLDLLARGLRLAHADIVLHSAIEQVAVLPDGGDLILYAAHGLLAERLPAYAYAACPHGIKARQKLGNGGFAAAGSADEGGRGARWDVEGNAMKHVAVRRVIGEGDVFKAYIRGGGRFSGSSLLGEKRQMHGLVLQLDNGIGSHHAAITHVPGVDEVGHGREACADEKQGVDQRVRLHMAPRALIRGDGDGKGIAKPCEKLQDHVFQHGDA